jgi:hypothetical protein
MAAAGNDRSESARVFLPARSPMDGPFAVYRYFSGCRESHRAQAMHWRCVFKSLSRPKMRDSEVDYVTPDKSRLMSGSRDGAGQNDSRGRRER